MDWGMSARDFEIPTCQTVTNIIRRNAFEICTIRPFFYHVVQSCFHFCRPCERKDTLSDKLCLARLV